MKIKSLLVFSVFTSQIALNSFAANDAGLPGEFLNFGVGARPLAMGRAFTGVSDDIDSIYWNPAGLASYRSSQVAFQHSPLELGGAHQYFAYSQPIYAAGNLGVGIINLTSGKVTKTDTNNIEVGDFENRETGYLVSYGHRFGDKLGLGGTVKMAEHSIDGKSARGFGADVGSLFFVNDRFKLGAMLRNAIAPKYSFDTDSEKFPTIFRGGASYSFFSDHLLTAVDLDKTLGTSQSMKWHVGVEGHVIKNVFLRAGLDQTEITGGLGLRWKTVQFDYAAGFQELGVINRVSIKIFFGGYEVDVKATPEVFSPVGLKNKTLFRIDCRNRQRITNWIMTIRNARGDVMRSFQGYSAPPATLEWDGKDAGSQNVEPGEYTYRMAVTDTKNKTEMTPARTLRIVAPTPLEIEAK